MIAGFSGEYAFLSSFWQEGIRFRHPDMDGHLIWDTNEHAFQAAKTSSLKEIGRVYTAPTPREAKTIGRSVTLRPGWDGMRKQVMLTLVTLKFSNVEMKKKLVATAPHVLVEGNAWHDNFWGQCGCTKCTGLPPGTRIPYGDNHPGKNYLGKILMAVRDVMQDD